MERAQRFYIFPKRMFLFAALAVVFHIGGGSAMAASLDYDPEHVDKSGRIMLNVRGGPAFGIVNTDEDLRLLGGVGLDFGVALSRDYNAYLVLTPQVDLRQGLYNVLVPLGFQYDIRLVRGLFLYPRVSLGYSLFVSNSSVDIGSLHLSASELSHGGVAIPELGLKYVVNGRFNIGIEPLSIPVVFNSENYWVWYRVNLFLGGNF